ncbi:MAG: MFS transporter [Eubacterium sp.]|nr:MFS transporter [Eubacterium sp.]
MEENKKNQHPNKIGIKEAIGYMLGDSGNLFVLTYVSSFLKIFYTDVLKIAPERVARLFLFTRFWDAVNDPIWGALVAKRPPDKNGKYRSYLKWIALPLAISELLCFLNISKITQNDLIIMIFAYVTYIAFGMLYTGINVPFGSLASVITDDPDGRTLLSTFRSIGGGIGGAAPLLIAPFIIYTKMDDGQGGTYDVVNDRGMMLFALAMAVCSVIFYIACYNSTKERVPSDADPKFDLKSTYISMFKSRPFIAVALAGILISGQLQFASLNQYLYKNYFCDTNLSVLGTVAQYLPMAIMIPFMPKLSKKYGKKEISGIGSFFAAVAAILIFVLKPARDQSWIFMVLLFVIGFGYSFVSITNWAVITDVIDYQEYKTGIKTESALYAVYTFCRKLGQTIADYGGLTLLGKIGYDATKMANAGYVEGVSEGILTICTLIPAIVYTLIFVLYKFAYPLTKEKLAPVYKYVREKNQAAISESEEAAAEQ